MKSIRVQETGGPEVLKIQEIADPHPGAGQVVVRIHAAGVNPVETYIRSGAYARMPNLPYTPGSDGAGVVQAVGVGVGSTKPGDRVYTSASITGTYSELALCLESQVHPLPANVSFAQGAALGIPYATAYRALFQRARAVPGEWVLVHGASGGVGIAAVQLARGAGLRVIGTAGSEPGRKVVAEQGAHQVLDHQDPHYLHQIKSFRNGRGMDIILEMLANVNLGKDLSLLGRGGRVVIIGNRGTVEINPREAMSRDADILGMTLFNASESDLSSIHAALTAGLESGTLRPVIGRELPLSEAPRAHQAILEPGAIGKIVLIP